MAHRCPGQIKQEASSIYIWRTYHITGSGQVSLWEERYRVSYGTEALPHQHLPCKRSQLPLRA